MSHAAGPPVMRGQRPHFASAGHAVPVGARKAGSQEESPVLLVNSVYICQTNILYSTLTDRPHCSEALL